MKNTKHTKTNLLDAIFKDKQGNIVLAQAPNLPIIIAGLAWFMQLFIRQSPYQQILSVVFELSLATWAILEIGWGTNYFRRVLGFFVLIVVLAGAVSTYLVN